MIGFHLTHLEGSPAANPRTATAGGFSRLRRFASRYFADGQILRGGSLIVLLTCGLCAMTTGCIESNNDTAASTETQGNVTRTEVERGPVKLTVEMSPAKPRLSDEPTLTVTIRAKSGVHVESPPFGDAMGDFVIRDYYEPVPEAVDGAEILRQVYTLEPTQAGSLMVAPITVTFADRRSQGDDEQHSISSEPLQVEVTTLVGDSAPALSQLRPSAPPVELPDAKSLAGWWVAGGLSLAFISGLAIWMIRRRATPQVLPSPRELGLLELAELNRRGLAETDVKAWYVELTAVVRRFIERSSGIHAPEQTTEEFLNEIASASSFNDSEKQRLQVFLESADLVKFAGRTPSQAEISASLDRAREFIEAHREMGKEEKQA